MIDKYRHAKAQLMRNQDNLNYYQEFLTGDDIIHFYEEMNSSSESEKDGESENSDSDGSEGSSKSSGSDDSGEKSQRLSAVARNSASVRKTQ